jgi:hypothetical protein
MLGLVVESKQFGDIGRTADDWSPSLWTAIVMLFL